MVSDECYDEIDFDGTFVSPASISAERVVSVLQLLEDVRDDRLADRLRGGAAGGGTEPRQGAGADHLLRQRAHAVRGARRGDRPAGGGDRDARGVSRAPRPGAGGARGARRCARSRRRARSTSGSTCAARGCRRGSWPCACSRSATWRWRRARRSASAARGSCASRWRRPRSDRRGPATLLDLAASL